MKLASLKARTSRDGELCVVDRNLKYAVKVPHIAATLQVAIDNWSILETQLQSVYAVLNAGTIDNRFVFEPHLMSSPLPRAYQWADGSAYVNHVELVRKARGVTMPENFWTEPLMYQGGSDGFLGPHDSIPVADINAGVDFEAELAVITDDVPMGTSVTNAAAHIKLMMLVNDVSLRNLIPAELAKGFGFFQSKPASSFSPVAITLDEFGANWQNERVSLPLCSYINDQLFGQPNAGVDMVFSFAQLIAHASYTRSLSAGTIIGSGTVSNCDRSLGSSCIVEKRMLEILEYGAAVTEYMQFGDKIRIEMLNDSGCSLFGDINQQIIKY